MAMPPLVVAEPEVRSMARSEHADASAGVFTRSPSRQSATAAFERQAVVVRLVGVNPNDYLTDVLPKLARGISIARDLPALMPLAWLRAR